MLLDQGIVSTWKRDGVEIQVEGPPAGQAEHGLQRIEPEAHQLGIASRVDPAAVLGEERALRDHVEPGEQGQAA